MVSKSAESAIPHFSHGDDEVDDPNICYPSSDGEPMAESDHQYVPLTNTVSALRVRYRNRDDVYIAGDMLVYYRINRADVRVAPDVFAVFGATGNHRRDSWLVWREGRAPNFVMEVAPRSTWQRDITEKRPIYAAMGVQEYVRFDPTGSYFTPALALERLDDGIYREQPLYNDAAGILRGHSAVLGLDICVLPGLELRLYDPATGQWLLTHQEAEDARQAEAVARQAEAVARQAEAAARQAEAAARQVAENALLALEAENARLREQLQRLPDQP